ncbi:O-succinylhomoserine sulfhydrylase [Rhodovibrionaceae bacterium A322]
MNDDSYQPEDDQAAWGESTKLVRAGLARSQFGETSEAVFLNSGFVYKSAEEAEARFKGEQEGFVYSRYGNPTVRMFEQRMAALEGAEDCFAASSGMAAVWAALMCQLKTGDHVVAARALFSSCHFILTELLPRYGIETTLVDGADLNAWKAATRPNTKVAFLETPSNPTLELVDITGVAEIIHGVGGRLVVDNVFATPLLQKPLELGADVVIYSATKHIDGQGRCLGGVILSDKTFITEVLQPIMRHTGPALSPFNAWTLLKGLETLKLRVRQMSSSALAIARLLEGSDKVAKVFYPGLESHPQYALAQRQMKGGSTLVAIELKGGKAEAFRFINALKTVDISNNLGDAKSLITHPTTTTHRSMEEADRLAIGVTDGLVRLSVGLEEEEDLLADITAALAVV